VRRPGPVEVSIRTSISHRAFSRERDHGWGTAIIYEADCQPAESIKSSGSACCKEISHSIPPTTLQQFNASISHPIHRLG
jgi:hypothetical protein